MANHGKATANFNGTNGTILCTNYTHMGTASIDLSGVESATTAASNAIEGDYGIKMDAGVASTQLLQGMNLDECIDAAEEISNTISSSIDTAKTEIGNILSAVQTEASRIQDEVQAAVAACNSEDEDAKNKAMAEAAAAYEAARIAALGTGSGRG